MATRLIPIAVLVSLLFAFNGRPALGASFSVNSTADAVDANPGDGISGPVVFNGAPEPRAFIDGAGIDRVIEIKSSSAVRMDGLVVRGGTISGDFAFGGGIYTESLDLRLSNVEIIENEAYFGGAIFFAAGANGTLEQVNVMANNAEDGGGVFTVDGSKVIVRSSTFLNNIADADGGGIANGGFARTEISRSRFKGNRAAKGGGIANFGTLVLSDSTVEGNIAGSGAAGVHLAGGSAMVTGSSIVANVGTGIVNGVPAASEPTPPVTLSITNSSVSGNATGISNVTTGQLTATNVTIAYNSKFGLEVFGSATFVNTIFAYNQEEHLRLEGGSYYTGSDCDGNSGLNSLGHNLDTDGTCRLSGPGDLSNTWAGIYGLGDFGGPTKTHALFQLYCYDYSDVCDGPSYAIDAGDNTKCPTTDQRGMPRPVDGNADGVAVCDIGAFEVQDGPRQCQVGCGLFFVTPTPTPSPTPGAFPLTGGPPKNPSRDVPATSLAVLAVGISAAGIALLRRRGRRLEG